MTKDQRLARDHAALLSETRGLAQVFVDRYAIQVIDGKARAALVEMGWKWQPRIDGKGGKNKQFSIVADPVKSAVAWDLAIELGLTPYVALYRTTAEIKAAKRERSRKWRERNQPSSLAQRMNAGKIRAIHEESD